MPMPRYTVEQIEFILLHMVRGLEAPKIAIEYRKEMVPDATDGNVRYAKNKYCKDPRFGTPMWNWKGRPVEEYAQWLKDHPAVLTDPERASQGASGSLNESQPPPPRPDIAPQPAPPAVLKPETRARARKNGGTPTRRTRKPRAKKIQAGEPMNTGPAAIPAAYLPKGPPLPENITDSELGGPDRVMAVVMAGLRYPSGQLSLPELTEATYAAATAASGVPDDANPYLPPGYQSDPGPMEMPEPINPYFSPFQAQQLQQLSPQVEDSDVAGAEPLTAEQWTEIFDPTLGETPGASPADPSWSLYDRMFSSDPDETFGDQPGFSELPSSVMAIDPALTFNF